MYALSLFMSEDIIASHTRVNVEDVVMATSQIFPTISLDAAGGTICTHCIENYEAIVDDQGVFQITMFTRCINISARRADGRHGPYVTGRPKLS